MTAVIAVVEAGIATTVQDRGRPGFAHLGIPPSGAVDPRLAALTNRLVGNPPGAALIETCGNFVMRVTAAALIATSSELAPISLAPGERLRVTVDRERLWQYVAVRGGIETAEVLGSRSTDTLSGLGPPPLTIGDMISVGPEPDDPVAVDQAPRPDRAGPALVGPGPRLDWFQPACFERLVAASWIVSESSRIGVRLRGVSLPRRIHVDLPSEGLVRGAIQVPPDSQPVMMLADHPTTGGYPVIAVVHPDDVGTVAHTSPGGTVRFTDQALR
jgi:biotin-dependent carboxylase-like uncharacterized protein